MDVGRQMSEVGGKGVKSDVGCRDGEEQGSEDGKRQKSEVSGALAFGQITNNK